MQLKRRSLMVAIILVVVAGCSSTKFIYTKLDWFLPHYIGSYVSFNNDQRKIIDTYLNELIPWHCQTQLQQYAVFLRDVASVVNSNDIPTTKIAQFNDQLQVHWRHLVERATPYIVDILYGFDVAQTTELFKNLAEHNEDKRKDLVGVPIAEAQAEMADHLTERFERWIGEIDDHQRDLINAWSGQNLKWQIERLTMQRQWQRHLQDVMNEKGGRDKFAKQVSSLLLDPQQLWNDNYKDFVEKNRQSMYELIRKVYLISTSYQRHYLRDALNDWARDMDGLVCEIPTKSVSS